jgi:hypothetical protein
MSEMMKKILADKARTRKRLAALPFDKKLAILERMRDRNIAISTSPLRSLYQTKPFVVVAANGEMMTIAGSPSTVLKRPVVRQFQDQLNILQSSKTEVVGLEKLTEYLNVKNPEQVEPE